MAAVASADRLAVLAHLERVAGGIATLDELAEYVATRQGRADGATLNHVRLRLYHVDLPVLAAAGVVEFDTDTDTVEYVGMPSVPGQDGHVEFVVGPEGVQ
jgi:hypothetical protein